MEGIPLCARCGSPLRHDSSGGRCIWTGCRGRLCSGCWEISKFRFCRKHAEGGGKRGRPAWPGSGEEHFPDVTAGIRQMHESRSDGKSEKSRYYASEYWRWLSYRVERDGPPDWTPRGMLKSPSLQTGNMGEARFIRVSAGRWPGKKPALSIIVIPCDWGAGFDRHALDAAVRKAARGWQGYSLVALAGDGAPMEAADFVNRFSDSMIFLYLAEPRRGHLNYNVRDPVTKSYAEWFSQKGKARRFREKVRDLGSPAGGRMVVTKDAIEREFGFRKGDVGGIIRSCGFLHPAGEGKYYVSGG